MPAAPSTRLYFGAAHDLRPDLAYGQGHMHNQEIIDRNLVIVAKGDELMALCERLVSLLTTTQTESRRLLESVLQQALTPVA
ncbi:MAG: hypothetical protein MUF51_06590 [Vicinamibacteria bacterium]|jgi:hypothetical protein|nr:hypothetical protein [Vicinamibacteria bacterium]